MVKKIIFAVLLAGSAQWLGAQTYSISMQPDASTGMDASITSSNTSLNQGSSAVLRASRDMGGNLERSFLQFDLTSIPPGVIIVSANLTLFGTNHNGSGDGDGVLQCVPDPWDQNSVTWDNAMLLYASDQPSVAIAAPHTSTDDYTLDVTGMVQTMVNTPLVNFGWMLRMAVETGIDNKSLEFGASDNMNSAKRPLLEITYVYPMQVNAYLAPSGRDTSHNAGVSLNVSLGAPPYTYAWSNGATSKDINNIAAGIYTVTVTDSRGYKAIKVIPAITDCGSMTYTLNYGPQGSFNDAMMARESFNDNTANSNFGSIAGIKAYNKASSGGNAVARSLVAFDLGMLPDNIQVNSARLSLHNEESPVSPSFKVQLCRVTQAWDQETVTNNNQPSSDTITDNVVEFDYDASQSTYTFDVTNHVQNMIANNSELNGWLLKLKSETSSGTDKSVTFTGDNSSSTSKPSLALNMAMPSVACNDDALNWIREDTYDENGTLISSEKNYMDDLGRGTQHMVKNASGDVFTSQTLYDSYGRPAISSMPAYTGNQLVYQYGFMRNPTGQPYSKSDFDLSTNRNSPALLQTGISKTLGNYYSNSNLYDPYQAIADNPYTRTEYTGDPGSAGRRVSKPGNAFKMGSNKENYIFTVMSGDELKNVYGTGLSYKAKQSSSNVLDCTPLSYTNAISATKRIVISPDNIESVTYSSGGKMLATCYSGLSAAESCTYSVKNMMAYNGTQDADIHLPDANKTSLYLPLPAQVTGVGTIYTSSTNISYTFTDLYNDRLLVAGTDYSVNPGSRLVTFKPAFLSAYTGRSLMLRIGFAYDTAFVSYIKAAGPVGGQAMTDVELDYSLCYGRFSKNYYDLGSALLKSVSPKGFACSTPTTITMASTYNYDHQGRMIAMQSPDEGTVQSIYDTEGKLRFTQNSEQFINCTFSYINYDKHGRPIESGEYTSNGGRSGSNLLWFSASSPTTFPLGSYFCADIADVLDGVLSAGKTNITSTSYTVPASTEDIPSGYSYISQYRSFRNGQVNFVKNNNSITWFNYDKVDRKTASVVQILESDFLGKKTGIDNQIKTNDFSYNYYNGLTTSSTYQNNNSAEKLYYQFSYDANYRPVQTRLTYGGTTYTLSSSSYNKMGQLRRQVTGNNYQGTDYVYTLNGGLKAINHPGLDPTLDPGADTANYKGYSSQVNKDLFGEILEFYNGDYERSNTNMVSSISSGNSKYNGLLYAQRFKTRSAVNTNDIKTDYINYGGSGQVQLITGTNYKQQELRFDYSYDEFNQLAKSVFGTYNNSSNTATQRSEYAESGPGSGNITYDRNGNLTRLVRQAYNSEVLDNLTYTVGSSNNRLVSIVDAATNTYAATFNFKTSSTVTASSFSFNSIGQMTASPAEDIASIIYFPNGKIKKITYSSTGNTVEYEYGAEGGKIKSKYYLAASSKYKYSWYVGPYIYEYDELAATPGFTIAEAKTPTGLIRVNGTSVGSGYLVYQVADHQGNVRATYKASGTGSGIYILTANDYYAFGGQLPGRGYTASGENYRYGYQGQEKGDNGSPWDQFELRLYNHDIGRWFAPDPYGQFASPYIAMANNPVSTVDPDGGWVDFSTGKPGEFPNKAIMDEERATGQGAWAPEFMQQRYEDEFKSLTNHFLNYEYGARKDIDGYLNAINDLNNEYYGLTYFTRQQVAYKNGTERLNISEITRFGLAVSRNQANINGNEYKEGSTADLGDITAYSQEKFIADKATGKLQVGFKFNEQVGEAVMVNASTGKVDVVKSYSDGSEIHVTYDPNGEKRADGSVAIEEVKFMTADEVESRNEMNSGSSWDSRSYLEPTKPDGSSQSGQIMAGALMLGGVTSELPPVAAAIVAGGAIAAVAVYAYEKIGGKDGFHTTHQPVSQNPIHNQNNRDNDPESNLGRTLRTAAGWGVAAGLTAKGIDELQSAGLLPSFNGIPIQDNTYVAPKAFPLIK